MTIRSFRCADTEALYDGKHPRQFRNIDSVSQRKLQMLDDAVELRDLRSPPGNRLEALGGDRKGQCSIRINDQWRVCFVWTDSGPKNVEIVDYH
ncbi:MAG: type II toxin-antitoxin system RelE/ParE family toxin [Rhodocyclaceae bacterium]|nr:type II toxin-antitoxin system RelE/ParE family toxin [Rhodocyclaceae bacterium]